MSSVGNQSVCIALTRIDRLHKESNQRQGTKHIGQLLSCNHLQKHHKHFDIVIVLTNSTIQIIKLHSLQSSTIQTIKQVVARCANLCYPSTRSTEGPVPERCYNFRCTEGVQEAARHTLSSRKTTKHVINNLVSFSCASHYAVTFEFPSHFLSGQHMKI